MSGSRVPFRAALAGSVAALVAAAASGVDLGRNFHNGEVGERLFARTLAAAVAAFALVAVAIALRRGDQALRRLGAAAVGSVFLGFGGWLALRPVDMGSYEPNCLPPIAEGAKDERCSDVPRATVGTALLAGALIAAALGARRPTGA